MAVSTSQAHLTGIEKRVARLEDIEAIKNLKIQYAAFCDQNYDPDGIASLFHEGGTWQADPFGVKNVGQDEIRKNMAEVGTRIPWALHFVMGPVIDVAADGLTAVGTWYLLVLCSMKKPDGLSGLDAVVMSGTYQDEFAKANGLWKFTHISADIQQVSNLAEGWVTQQYRGR